MRRTNRKSAISREFQNARAEFSMLVLKWIYENRERKAYGLAQKIALSLIVANNPSQRENLNIFKSDIEEIIGSMSAIGLLRKEGGDTGGTSYFISERGLAALTSKPVKETALSDYITLNLARGKM